jgi:filamentous hemagglutinin family protein
MQHGAYRFRTASSIFLLCLATTGPLQAQIVPDATLPVNSVVTPEGSTSVITGGTAVGGNLFHSFKEFSVKTGTTAHFRSAPEISNILTRVTGLTVSNIDGIISAAGKANLFLINPNGIIFGPNARLNIGGSFIGSTASSIKLSDGSFYSAAPSAAPPLLTVSVPWGLQFGPNPGGIGVRGAGHSLRVENPIYSPLVRGNAEAGLRVSAGNTLALVGGDVSLEGGVLTAEGGRIELGSVDEGAVSLSPSAGGWTLDYSGVGSFRDVRLSRQALADASGMGGGGISVRGRRVEVGDGSIILMQNFGERLSGSVSVQAAESVQLSGTTPDGRIPGGLYSETLGGGNGGEIAVSTRQLVIQNGAAIASKTFSAGEGGNITVNASDSAELINFSPVNPLNVSFTGALALGSGKAGDIAVSARRLTVKDGGSVISVTFGRGDGGDVSVSAAQSVELVGVVPGVFSPSLLSAATVGAGNAGSLRVSTGSLVLRDGGRLDASTVGAGNAGSVTVSATESVEIRGTVPGSVSPSLVISSANKVDEILQRTYGLPRSPSGTSGDVTINTPRLTVSDGAQVTVRNDGSGNAGTLAVNAGSIFLDSKSGLTASTESGEGGNINLQVRDALLLRNGSQISATAGGGTGSGGNLTISAPVIAALENSDISANAFQGAGGNIKISTSGIFGSEYRVAPTAKSDITASSQFGVSGTVTISNPEVDPSSGLVELPENFTDSAGEIVTGCAADKGNTFAVSGRGGLPENPSETLRGATLWSDLRPVRKSSADLVETRFIASFIASFLPSYPGENSQSPIVEATGWVIDEKGRVQLVANAPDVAPQEGWQKYGRCGGF